MSYAVLGLVSLGARTAYEIKQKASGSVGYFWSFPHSQIYAESARLAELDLLAEEREPGGRHRRVYSLTPEGRAALRAWLREPTGESPQIRDTGLLKLFFAAELSGDEISALARAQEAAHRARLGVYESIAPAIEDSSRAHTLRAGLLFERTMVGFWQSVARESASPSP